MATSTPSLLPSKNAKREVTPILKAKAAPKAKTPKADLSAIPFRAPKVRSPRAEVDPERKAILATEAVDLAAAKKVSPITRDAEAAKAGGARLERLALAKQEHAAAKAWIAGGKKGAQPLTPNLDAIALEDRAGKAKTGKAKTPKAPTSERIAAARAGSAKARGKGLPISDDELDAWIIAERKADPTITRSAAQKVNRHVAGFSCSFERFGRGWARVVGA